MNTSRVVLLTNMIAPYRIPLFNEIARQCPGLHVIFLCSRESSRSWVVPDCEIAFSYEVLDVSNWLMRSVRSALRFNPMVIQALRRSRPQALIIGGWGYVENWASLFYAKMLGIPVVLWGGITGSSSAHTGRMAHTLRSSFVKMADAIVSYSTCAAHVFQEYGAAPDRIAVGCNVGDVEFYFTNVELYRRTEEYRNEHGRWPRPLFLYVGQFVPRKGLRPLLDALRRLETSDWGLVLVGSGPEEEDLVEFCREHKMNHRVYFAGFHPREALVRYYALADVFILPSLQEPGAIVLSEALASGLFLLGSRHDGVAPDLISHSQQNGLLIDPSNPDRLSGQIAQTISRYVNQPWDRCRIAAEFVENRPIARYASAFLEGMRIAQQ